ncbi:MAG: hypothetical protein UR66_C0005G0017 [Candidatus Moranbacteria bacterium GW2011_GWE1_35_17]|nr:MAG: hypothetical protein UR66_C0005G0017 [Candidatus Moranbacteria bacterium GW2011_GWE1_35_17]KKP83773.1 MAG: hypothetical protein UR83_C0033G0003 [Candidatus Moranbacteria bacterium GW2011_GWF2_35_54]
MKWKPVHQICTAQLSKSCVSAVKLQHWAEIYADGTIAPPKSIPDLIKAFQRAEKKLEGQIKISEIALAIARLNEQLEEEIVIGDVVSFKKEVIDGCKESSDTWDVLIGKTSPKDKFKVLDIDSNGKVVLKEWCIIFEGKSTPIPIDLRLLRKVVAEKKTCEVHNSIEHMQSVTGLCPGCNEP